MSAPSECARESGCRGSARIAVFVVVVFAGLFTGCGGEGTAGNSKARTGLPKNVLARVGDISITLEDFEREQERTRGRFSNRSELLEEMIRGAVFLQRAREAGFDQKPEMVARIHRFIAAQFEEEQMGRRMGPAAVSEEEIEGYYRKHEEQFRIPEMVRAGVILIRCSTRATEEKRAELLERAREIREEAQGADAAAWMRLVARYSEDQATRYAGGDTGWMERSGGWTRWDPAIVSAGFSAGGEGTLAPLVETSEGFHIIRITGRKGAEVRPLGEVREAIEHWLSRERREAAREQFLAEMKRGVRIEMNTELWRDFDEVAPPMQTKPPAVPGT